MHGSEVFNFKTNTNLLKRSFGFKSHYWMLVKVQLTNQLSCYICKQFIEVRFTIHIKLIYIQIFTNKNYCLVIFGHHSLYVTMCVISKNLYHLTQFHKLGLKSAIVMSLIVIFSFANSSYRKCYLESWSVRGRVFSNLLYYIKLLYTS